MRSPDTIRNLLVGGYRTSVGRAKEIAAMLICQPKKTGEFIQCLWDDDPGVANRAADALESASRTNPQLIAPWKNTLLGRMPDAVEKKLKWNLGLMISRVQWTVPETERAAAILRT